MSGAAGPPTARRSPRPTSGSKPPKPPVWMLGVAALAVLTSGALLRLSGRSVDLVGYLLATLVTVLFVAGFRSIDNRRRSRPTYELPLLARRLPPPVASLLLLGAGVVVGGLHVWRFADAVARQ